MAQRPISSWQTQRALLQAKETAAKLRAEGYGDDYQLLIDSLDGETDVFESLDRIVNAAEDAKAVADSLGRRMSDMQIRKIRFERLRDILRADAQAILEAADLAAPGRPLRRDFYTASVSPGPRHVIPTKQPEEMDPRFQRVKVEASLTALGDALDAGEEDVPAVWSNPRNILRIYTK
jgi:hypothetical protein